MTTLLSETSPAQAEPFLRLFNELSIRWCVPLGMKSGDRRVRGRGRARRRGRSAPAQVAIFRAAPRSPRSPPPGVGRTAPRPLRIHGQGTPARPQRSGPGRPVRAPPRHGSHYRGRGRSRHPHLRRYGLPVDELPETGLPKLRRHEEVPAPPPGAVPAVPRARMKTEIETSSRTSTRTRTIRAAQAAVFRAERERKRERALPRAAAPV